MKLQSTKLFGHTIQVGKLRKITTVGRDSYQIIVDVRGDIQIEDLA